MLRYEQEYKFVEYPKWVHGLLVQDEAGELDAMAKHEAKLKHAKKMEAEASEQAIGEMQEAIRREKRK